MKLCVPEIFLFTKRQILLSKIFSENIVRIKICQTNHHKVKITYQQFIYMYSTKHTRDWGIALFGFQLKKLHLWPCHCEFSCGVLKLKSLSHSAINMGVSKSICCIFCRWKIDYMSLKCCSLKPKPSKYVILILFIWHALFLE